eukprot:TRINITY_DN8934_c0_g1_i1.p1 TRINITY_DN8934_c0_g1~~TRINITY_DN8934_c0_g1_i1.p1  ORF type:complete len:749 (+),score=281.28 TRINITY_DN8934_c0_g1_i1:67-2313(+)
MSNGRRTPRSIGSDVTSGARSSRQPATPGSRRAVAEDSTFAPVRTGYSGEVLVQAHTFGVRRGSGSHDCGSSVGSRGKDRSASALSTPRQHPTLPHAIDVSDLADAAASLRTLRAAHQRRCDVLISTVRDGIEKRAHALSSGVATAHAQLCGEIRCIRQELAESRRDADARAAEVQQLRAAAEDSDERARRAEAAVDTDADELHRLAQEVSRLRGEMRRVREHASDVDSETQRWKRAARSAEAAADDERERRSQAERRARDAEAALAAARRGMEDDAAGPRRDSLQRDLSAARADRDRVLASAKELRDRVTQLEEESAVLAAREREWSSEQQRRCSEFAADLENTERRAEADVRGATARADAAAAEAQAAREDAEVLRHALGEARREAASASARSEQLRRQQLFATEERGRLGVVMLELRQRCRTAELRAVEAEGAVAATASRLRRQAAAAEEADALRIELDSARETVRRLASDARDTPQPPSHDLHHDLRELQDDNARLSAEVQGLLSDNAALREELRSREPDGGPAHAREREQAIRLLQSIGAGLVAADEESREQLDGSGSPCALHAPPPTDWESSPTPVVAGLRDLAARIAPLVEVSIRLRHTVERLRDQRPSPRLSQTTPPSAKVLGWASQGVGKPPPHTPTPRRQPAEQWSKVSPPPPDWGGLSSPRPPATVAAARSRPPTRPPPDAPNDDATSESASADLSIEGEEDGHRRGAEPPDLRQLRELADAVSARRRVSEQLARKI